MRAAAQRAPRRCCSSRHLGPPEVFLHQLCGEDYARIVFGAVLELLEVVQPAGLVDPVGRRDEARRLVGAGVEMLVDGVRRDVDDVACLPLVALHLGLRLPVVGVGDLGVAVLVQVIAAAFEDVDALLCEMAVLPGAAARRDDLHVGVDRLHARVHALVDEVLEQPLARHLPGHVLGAHDLLAFAVPRRGRRRVIQQRLVELLVVAALLPRFRFVPGHVYSSLSLTLKPSAPGAGSVGRGSMSCWNSMFMNMYIGLVLMTSARAGLSGLALKCWCTQLLCTIATSPACQS